MSARLTDAERADASADLHHHPGGAMSKTRVDLILQVEKDHMAYAVGVRECSQGEHWRCKCGKSYKGDGAIQKGRRHTAKRILRALDEAVS